MSFSNYAQQLNLLFVGDAMQHETQLKSAQTGEDSYSYDSCYMYISPIFKQADFTMLNLEVPLGSKPYAGYPTFCAPAAYATALQDAGVNVMITANNHSCDKGAGGIKGTIEKLDSLGIIHTGMFSGSAQRTSRYPLIIEKNGIRLAVLNYTYGTNGIKVPQPYIVNLINEEQIVADVDLAKNLQPDIIVACMHWGDEYVSYPNRRQKRLASLLDSLGVRLIIGSHPHVVQPMIFQPADSVKESRLTVYSLGNFISNQRKLNTDGGAMVRVMLSKHNDSISIDSVSFLLTWVHTPTVNRKKKFYVLPISHFEQDSSLWKNDTAAFNAMQTFASNARSLLNKENKGVSEEFVYWLSDSIRLKEQGLMADTPGIPQDRKTDSTSSKQAE
ncbi:MAG: CapA family protein [Prevotellaceae bacterium]|nr:CapA family protein [Prevotellaceae bacterium]